MFQVEDVPPDHPPYKTGFTRYVVDHERGVWLDHIGGPHAEPPDEEMRGFRFYRDGLLTLVEANIYAGPNIYDTPAEGHETRILSFGYSPWGSLKTGIHTDPLERVQVMAALPLLAEALLVFGTLYNGALYSDRVVTSTLYDEPMRWTWADFGYTAAVS
ncbi:hypothetical protein [Glaciihabitans sp. GrIS 2.15]|uniref:hypothetical protein n=1 Tax=Glaciihabitans sp. GrIS 2.15 TaxID=3071710 RepID=UPI002E07BDC1|nr:hypothetical protein [Glaciihabitans sp. GrIS 2.15]